MADERYPDSGADRRAYPRSPVIVREARCTSGMEVFFGYAQNISRSGLFIGTTKQRPVGTEYEIQFRLPGLARDFRCMSRVVWVRPFRPSIPPGFGLEFLGLSEEDKNLIDEWVGGHMKTDPA